MYVRLPIRTQVSYWLTLLLLVLSGNLKAEKMDKPVLQVPGIYDAAHYLTDTTRVRLQQMVLEVAQRRQVYLGIVVMQSPFAAFEESTLEMIKAWEQANLWFNKKKIIYFIINARTHQIHIATPMKESRLNAAFYPIYQDLMLPRLQAQALDKAVWEGAVALSLIFEEEAEFTLRPFSKGPLLTLLSQPNFSKIMMMIKTLMLITSLSLAGLWLKRYLRTPHWEEEPPIATPSVVEGA